MPFLRPILCPTCGVDVSGPDSGLPFLRAHMKLCEPGEAPTPKVKKPKATKPPKQPKAKAGGDMRIEDVIRNFNWWPF